MQRKRISQGMGRKILLVLQGSAGGAARGFSLVRNRPEVIRDDTLAMLTKLSRLTVGNACNSSRERGLLMVTP